MIKKINVEKKGNHSETLTFKKNISSKDIFKQNIQSREGNRKELRKIGEILGKGKYLLQSCQGV